MIQLAIERKGVAGVACGIGHCDSEDLVGFSAARARIGGQRVAVSAQIVLNGNATRGEALRRSVNAELGVDGIGTLGHGQRAADAQA